MQEIAEGVRATVDSIHDELRTISLEIHDHPELQYKEFHAHEVLTKYMSSKSGWKVTPSAYDIKTAFVAVYDSGKKGPVASRSNIFQDVANWDRRPRFHSMLSMMR